MAREERTGCHTRDIAFVLCFLVVHGCVIGGKFQHTLGGSAGVITDMISQKFEGLCDFRLTCLLVVSKSTSEPFGRILAFLGQLPFSKTPPARNSCLNCPANYQ